MHHYSLKKYQHPTYALCRSYGLVGKLETASPATILTNRPKLSIKASVAVFAIRALTAWWSFSVGLFYFTYMFPELADDVIGPFISVNFFDNIDYLGNIEVDWIRRWKQCALVAPYMLVCTILVVDIAYASKIQFGIFTLTSAAMFGFSFFSFGILVTGTQLLTLMAGVVTWALLMMVLHRHRQQHRALQTRRIGLLYAQYFGVNGSLFPLKVIVFQAATVILQTLGKLLLLGEIANMQVMHDGWRPGRVVHGLFFTLLGLNATIPALLLQAESVFWQRIAVCYLDIFFDLMYTLVFGGFMLVSLFFEATAPADALSFGSCLLPLLHILSVARAIEMHHASTNANVKKDEDTKENRADKEGNIATMDDGVKGDDATNETTSEQRTTSKPLSRKVALGFLVFQVITMAAIMTSHQSLYPFTSDPCAPCTCPSGVLDCSGIQRAQSLQFLWLMDNQLTTLPEGAFEGLASLQEMSLQRNQLTALSKGAFKGLRSLRDLRLYNNQLTTLHEGAFDDLGLLRDLRLDNNQLTNLPEGAFEGLASLRWLYLDNNQFTTLPVGTLENLASLRGLSLYGNQLTTLPKIAFEGLASLERLYIDNNQFTTFPKRTFEGLSSLQELSLFNNQLTFFPEGAFDDLVSLQHVWLWNNTISCVDLGALPDKARCHDSCADVKPDDLNGHLKWRLERYGVGVCQL